MAGHSSNFLAQILEAPRAAIALRMGDHTLTYSQLLQAAQAVSAALSDANLAPQSRVGICMERGLLAPVSLLGCLLAGHTYVPLDPGYPAARRANRARIAELALLLCHASTAQSTNHPHQ